jgi:aspartate aminotransferase
MRTSRRASQIALSVTIALDTRAKELVAAGRDVINMAVGELDASAPAAVREAAVRKVESGDVRYTPAGGTKELRETIARHLADTRGTEFSPDEVVVCHSAKHALTNAMLALAGEGDEVLVPQPAWVSYVEIVKVSGASPVPVPPGPGCTLALDRLAAAVTPRTRGVMINSPSNPSGYVMSRAETEAIAALAAEHDLWILSDEIYRRLVYEGEPALSPASLGPEARARTVIVDGASKAFAMTGYRIGYLAAPVEVAKAVTRLQSQMTGAPNTVSQAAFGRALVEEPPEVADVVAVLDRRRGILLEGLARLGLETPEPRGAFYVFPDVSRYLDERGSGGFCEDLLEGEDLAIVPGTAFGAPDHVRLSYAIGEDAIREALARFERFLATR